MEPRVSGCVISLFGNVTQRVDQLPPMLHTYCALFFEWGKCLCIISLSSSSKGVFMIGYQFLLMNAARLLTLRVSWQGQNSGVRKPWNLLGPGEGSPNHISWTMFLSMLLVSYFKSQYALASSTQYQYSTHRVLSICSVGFTVDVSTMKRHMKCVFLVFTNSAWLMLLTRSLGQVSKEKQLSLMVQV